MMATDVRKILTTGTKAPALLLSGVVVALVVVVVVVDVVVVVLGSTSLMFHVVTGFLCQSRI